MQMLITAEAENTMTIKSFAVPLPLWAIIVHASVIDTTRLSYLGQKYKQKKLSKFNLVLESIFLFNSTLYNKKINGVKQITKETFPFLFGLK